MAQLAGRMTPRQVGLPRKREAKSRDYRILGILTLVSAAHCAKSEEHWIWRELC